MRRLKTAHILAPKPLVAAVAAVLAAPMALAGNFAPTTPGVNQLPGYGTVVTPAGGSAGVINPAGSVFTPAFPGGTVGGLAAPTNPGALGQSANAVDIAGGSGVITWGNTGTATINAGIAAQGAAQNAGFNIGSSAQFYVVNTAAKAAAVLNVDVSGATSVIAGKLTGAVNAPGNPYPDIFVSNANGIIVGSGATITTGALAADQPIYGPGAAPAAGGLGLLGVDLSGSQAQSDFVNVPVGAVITGTLGAIDLNFANSAPVRIDGGAQINGGISNSTGPGAPPVAPFGFPTSGGTAYTLLAGANAGTAPNITAGVSNAGTIVTNDLAVVAGQSFNVAGKGEQAVYGFNGSNNFVDVPTSGAKSAFANYGTFFGVTPSTATTAFASAPGDFVNSGTINDLGALSGFGQRAFVLANGNISNSGFIAAGSATVPSGIQLIGTKVTNTGTLQGNTLDIQFGTGGVDLGGTVTQFSGAIDAINRVSRVTILPQVVGGLVQQGDVKISAPITIHSDVVTDGPVSALSVVGKSVTISGAEQIIPLPGNNGANRAQLGVSRQAGDIAITDTGSLLAGNVMVGGFAFTSTAVGATSFGAAGQPYAANTINLPNLTVAGTITTTTSGSTAGGAMADPNAGGGFAVAADPDFIFNGYNLHGSGVAAKGGVTANIYDIYSRGNVRSPVAATDFLQNGFRLTARATPAVPAPQVGLSAIATARQFVNLGIEYAGTAQLYSGVTITPFSTPILTTGTFPAGNPSPNAQSSLIANATGNLDVHGSFGLVVGPVVTGTYTPDTYYFPGGIVFKAGGNVTSNNVMNAWTTTGIPFQGVFFESGAAGSISTGYIASNAGQFANFSTGPVATPVTYSMVLGNQGATVNFLAGSNAHRSDDPAATCIAGSGCTNTFSKLTVPNFAEIINTHPFN